MILETRFRVHLLSCTVRLATTVVVPCVPTGTERVLCAKQVARVSQNSLLSL